MTLKLNIKKTVDFAETNPMNYRTASIFAVLGGVLTSLISLWAHIDINTLTIDDTSHIGLVLPMNIFMSFAIYTFGFYMLRTEQHLSRRIFLLIVGALSIAAFFTLLTSFLSKWIYKGPNISRTFSVYAIKDLIVATIAILLTVLLFTLNQRHVRAMEMQRLKNTKDLMNYNILQSQLDPHFFFNSLTMLDNLIGHDDQKAKEYLHHLATAFRTSIGDGTPHTLREELNMVDSYIYILKIRFDNNLQFDFDIPEDRYKDYVVSFGVQLLVENVVKHNVISRQHPMRVKIYCPDEETLRVSNALLPKKNIEQQQSSHIGLDNLDRLYSILFSRNIVIAMDDNTFSVDIPLIKPAQAAEVITHLQEVQI